MIRDASADSQALSGIICVPSGGLASGWITLREYRQIIIRGEAPAIGRQAELEPSQGGSSS